MAMAPMLGSFLVFALCATQSSAEKVCPTGFFNRSATLPYCYAVSSDDIDELSAANEFCDSFNISAKTLTFDSREHLQDYVSFFEEKIGLLYQHVENTFLGYSAEINSDNTSTSLVPVPPNTLDFQTATFDSSLSKQPTSSNSKCVFQDFSTNKNGLVPQLVECSGGAYKSIRVVCKTMKTYPIVCKNQCGCNMQIQGTVTVISMQNASSSPCLVTLTAPEDDDKLVVEFESFNVGRSDCCRTHNLRVEDGTGEFRRFCGAKPEPIKTNNNTLTLGLHGQLDDGVRYVANVRIVSGNDVDNTPVLRTKQRPSGR